MSTVATTFQPTVTAAILSGNQWSPDKMRTSTLVTPKPQDIMLRIGIPNFNMHLATSLDDLQSSVNYSEIIARSLVDPGVSARLTLRNEPARDINEPIQIKKVTLNFDVMEHRPRALFFAESLYATLGLAENVNISMPEIGLNVSVDFDMPLSEISNMLQRRQVYFGLIVIECATPLMFEIPEFIPGEDIDAISFTYHAIVARDFRWLCNDVTLFMPATRESLTWINNLPTTEPGGYIYRVQFGPTPKNRTIFGQTIVLGDEIVFLDDAVIENHDDVLRELGLNDGHSVPVKFRPLSRKGRYLFPDAPRLPETPWDEKIVGFINLEGLLNEQLATRYHQLAALTLAGLTPEEIKAVTERPMLDEDAYLISG